MVQTSWIFFSNSPQEASGALACRALSNHRQSPMLAGCQNTRQSWKSCSPCHWDWSPRKPCWWPHQLCACCRKPWPIWLLQGRGCLQKGAAVPLILSTWQTSSDRRALCPFSYPFQLPIPALPLSLLLFLLCWEFLSCLRHGEVHWACIDVAVQEGEVRVPRAGAGEPGSRCTVVRAYDSIHLITSEQVSTYSSLSFSGKLL